MYPRHTVCIVKRDVRLVLTKVVFYFDSYKDYNQQNDYKLSSLMSVTYR